jgi:hypothetical protein
MLPFNYIRKYSGFQNKIKENLAQHHLDINRSSDHYDQIKKLNKIKTNEEKKTIDDYEDQLRKAELTPYDYELEGYMKR